MNIETRSVPTPLIRPLQEFLKELRLKLKALSPECQVIWYDSVDANGALNYQNQLNAKNRVYFNNCDGIFLNYWWQPGDLVVTRQNAGNRFDFVRSLTSSKRDVYVGVDVYSPEYVRKEADFWHRTLLSVTESGRMCLTQSPTCVTFFVRSVVWAEA